MQQPVLLITTGRRDIALPTDIVQEILADAVITPIDSCQHAVLGVINVRGAIVPVLEMGRICGQESNAPATGSKMIVISCEDNVLAIPVDDVMFSDEYVRLETEAADAKTAPIFLSTRKILRQGRSYAWLEIRLLIEVLMSDIAA